MNSFTKALNASLILRLAVALIMVGLISTTILLVVIYFFGIEMNYSEIVGMYLVGAIVGVFGMWNGGSYSDEVIEE